MIIIMIIMIIIMIIATRNKIIANQLSEKAA